MGSAEVPKEREGRVFGALKKILALVVLVLVAYAGFRWGAYVFPPLERLLGYRSAPVYVPAEPAASNAPSAELADSTLDRFERFRRGKGGDRLALSGPELSSVVRYSMPGLVPPGVSDPTVELVEGRIRLKARVAVAAFPKLDRLKAIAGVLPDTVPLELEGALVPSDQAFMALLVDKVEAAHIPIPKSMVAEVLNGLGRQAPASMPADALPVPIPDGVKSVYVQRDSLVLVAKK